MEPRTAMDRYRVSKNKKKRGLARALQANEINNREVYFGETFSLHKRLGVPRPEIPGWTHFRYDVLPSSLAQDRVELERMIIRQLASLFPSNENLNIKINLEDFKLVNKKIDTKK